MSFLKRTLATLLIVGGALTTGCGKPAAQKQEQPKRAVVQRQVIDSYEVKSCVLMPKPGETKEEYLLRRERLLKKRAASAENLKKSIERIKKSEKDDYIRSTAIEHRKREIEDLSPSRFLNYFTPEAQKRLKEGGWIGKDGSQSVNSKGSSAQRLYEGKIVNTFDDF